MMDARIGFIVIHVKQKKKAASSDANNTEGSSIFDDLIASVFRILYCEISLIVFLYPSI